MQIVLKNENNDLKEVHLGYNYMFLVVLITGFLVVPFALYVVHKKQYVEMVSAYFLIFIVNTLLASYILYSANSNILLILINLGVLFTALYIYPKYVNIWQCKRLAKRGFKPVTENSEIVKTQFQQHVENDTIFGSIYRFN